MGDTSELHILLCTILSAGSLARLEDKSADKSSERRNKHEQRSGDHGAIVHGHASSKVSGLHEFLVGKVGTVELVFTTRLLLEYTPSTLDNGSIRYSGNRSAKQPKIGNLVQTSESGEDRGARSTAWVRNWRQGIRLDCLCKFSGAKAIEDTKCSG